MGGVIADPQISRRALVEFVDDLAQLAAVQLFAIPSLKRFCNGNECAPASQPCVVSLTPASAAHASRARPLQAGVIRFCRATTPLTPPEWFLERQFITAGGIVELHAFRVELLWIEPITEPLKSTRVFLVGGSLHHGHEVFIASGAATVLGRALWRRRHRVDIAGEAAAAG